MFYLVSSCVTLSYLFVVLHIHVSGRIKSACEHAGQRIVKRGLFPIKHLVISSIHLTDSTSLGFKGNKCLFYLDAFHRFDLSSRVFVVCLFVFFNHINDKNSRAN